MFVFLASICLRLKDQGESVPLASGSYAQAFVRGTLGTLPDSSTVGRDGSSRGNWVLVPKGRTGKLTPINVLYREIPQPLQVFIMFMSLL